MGFLDTFKGNHYKQEAEQLRMQLADVQKILTPEMKEAADLQLFIRSLQERHSSLEQDIINASKELSVLQSKVDEKKKFLLVVDDEIAVQEFGLYKPNFEFANSSDYKDKLQEIRNKQKQLIKSKKAVIGNQNWQVNGSKSQGTKMVSDMQKLLLRAFNSECDEIIRNVKYTNYDKSLERMQKSAETISKLGTIMNISITYEYRKSKIEELRLAFEYRQKKQEEKELAAAARAEMREAAKLQKEIDEQRKKYEKEQTHYQTAYKKICEQLNNNPDDTDLLAKKAEIENHIADIEKSLEDIDYRQANQKAGYVYVISNIGAFGENIYKIGMTRRLDPQERIDELGDASVPFNFDVHAMIFSDNAPALESALHKAFEDRKVNMVNQRREFFNVTLDEIKKVVKNNFDKTVEFIDVPDAEQYRVSLKMREEQHT